MTALRPRIALLLLLGCSSGQPLTVDAAPPGTDGPVQTDAPGAGDLANLSLSPDLAPDLTSPPDLAPDVAPDLAPPPGPDALSLPESGGSCTAPPGVYGPFPGCPPPVVGGRCDLVCQSGCGCGQRCKLEAGNPVCRAEGPTFLNELAACDSHDDRCRPGTICVQESADHPACGARCYRHCRQDSDCPNSRCSIEIQFGTSTTSSKICSPPQDACDPSGMAACSASSGRALPTFGCYVMSSTYPDVPICDCAGNIPLGQPCTYEHECVPGAECVLAAGVRTCRRVCKLGVPPGTPPTMGGCTPSLICQPFPGSTQFGYCR